MKGLERVLGSGIAGVCVALSSFACDGDFVPPQPLAPPPCEDGRHALIEGFHAEAPLDYIGDYANGTLIDSMGTPCSGAAHAERCMTAFEAAQQANDSLRALIITDGDSVKLVGGQALLTLFGKIDTASEAIYFASSLGYVFDCSANATRVKDGIRVTVTGSNSNCLFTPTTDGEILVGSDGVLRDPDGAFIFQDRCVTGGRGI